MYFAHCLHFRGVHRYFRGEGSWWGGYKERSFHGGIFHGGRELSMEGELDLSNLFKKRIRKTLFLLLRIYYFNRTDNKK